MVRTVRFPWSCRHGKAATAAIVALGDLAVLVDHIAAGDCHDGPALELPTLVDAGALARVADRAFLIKVDQYQVGIETDLDVALARPEPEAPCGVGRIELGQP